MSTLIWTLLATVVLAAAITVYIFVSAARIFGAESDSAPAMKGPHKTRSSSDRRENSDRRVFKGVIAFPVMDRFGHTVSNDRRQGNRRHMTDRRLQAA